MLLLAEKEDLRFLVDTNFDIKYLSPVQKYVQWKLENNKWDDYNELYQASKMIERLKTQENIWMETHLLLKNEAITGVLLIVGGEIKKLENKYSVEDQEHSLLLKYFHIVDKGKGLGSYWLKSVILPYYEGKGFRQIYLNSTHPDSFPFYKRLGSVISQYEQPSDNNLFKRLGNSFLINI